VITLAVTKKSYGDYVTLEGTLAEVVGQLHTDAVPIQRVVMFHDGTNYVAVYKKL